MLRNAGFSLMLGVMFLGWSAGNGGFDGVGMTLLTVLPFLGITALVFAGLTIRDWHWKRSGWRKAVARAQASREFWNSRNT